MTITASNACAIAVRPAVAGVLVADDNGLVRRLLRLALEAHGSLEVVGEAADGHGAVALARALRPHVVVLDLAMPRMDGLEAAAAIREAIPGCRIVVFSSFDAARVAKFARRAGADCYVEKAAGFAAVAEAAAALAPDDRGGLRASSGQSQRELRSAVRAG
jgi:DNA-binding NarL/FixJ family response regulator